MKRMHQVAPDAVKREWEISIAHEERNKEDLQIMIDLGPRTTEAAKRVAKDLEASGTTEARDAIGTNFSKVCG